MDTVHTTADGSPVAVYLAVPAGEAPSLIHATLSGISTILELGAGAGRLTRVLSAYGHDVVAVDDDPQMLRHITTARTICQDLYELALPERFDAVVAASHLINDPDPARRQRLLAVCAAHTLPGGLVLVERHALGWASQPRDVASRLGPVEVALSVRAVRSDSFDAVATYRLGKREWQQSFTSAVVDDEELRRLGAGVGLSLTGWLNDQRTWACLRLASEDTD